MKKIRTVVSIISLIEIKKGKVHTDFVPTNVKIDGTMFMGPNQKRPKKVKIRFLEKVKLEKATSEYPSYSLSEKWATPDFYGAGKYLLYHSRRKYPEMGKSPGVMGDATQASRETGEQIIDAVVNDLVQLMLEIIASEEKT